MKRIALTLAFTVSLALTSRGVSVLSETFSYADGALTSVSGGAWVPHSSGGSLAIQVTNGVAVVRMTTATAEDIHVDFVTPTNNFTTNSGVTLYSSYNLIVAVSPTNFGTYITHYRDTNINAATGFGARVWVSQTNAVSGGLLTPGKFRIGIANGNSANPASGQLDQDLDVGTNYTVVTRFALSNGVSTLWINPTNPSDPSVTATDISTNNVQNAINVVSYCLRQGAQLGAGTGTNSAVLIDDLKIGTAFNDVAGTNTPPSLSIITTQDTPANTSTGPIPFTVQDEETQANSLSLSNSSSNPTLVTNIVIASADAGGTNRTVTITPQTGQQGSATITIYARDGVNISSSSFLLRVGVPSISDIPNQITYSNAPISGVPFTISDAETAAGSLNVKAASSNPTLITNIVFGGSGSNRTVSLIPESTQIGVSTITVFVDDGVSTNSSSFVLSVSPRVGLLLSDTFSYDGFDIPYALYLATFGSTNSPWQHASGLVTHEVQVTNGMAELYFTNSLGQTNSEDLAANLTNASFAATPFSVNSGAILYVAFTVNQKLLPSLAGDYFAHFKDLAAGNTFRAKIFASTTNAASGKYRIGIANAANIPSAQFPVDLNLDQTYLVVARYNIATAESVLWVDPGSENSAHVSATDSAATSSVGSYGLREDAGIGLVDIDNLVIGTAFTDVVPILSITKSGNNAVISWGDPSYLLQASTNVLGVYTNIPGATSPHSYPILGSQRYFRLNR